MAIPLPQFLAEFRTSDALREENSVAPVLQPIEPPPSGSTRETSAQLVEDAFSRGEEAGRASARVELEQMLAGQARVAEERLVSERSKWTSEQADRLSAQLVAGIQDLEARIATSVLNILKPFLHSEVRNHMVQALTESIQTLLSNEHNAALHVSGPEDLIGALRAKLSALPASIRYETTEGTEVRVCADRTVIETQIQAWIDRFDKDGRGL